MPDFEDKIKKLYALAESTPYPEERKTALERAREFELLLLKDEESEREQNFQDNYGDIFREYGFGDDLPKQPKARPSDPVYRRKPHATVRPKKQVVRKNHGATLGAQAFYSAYPDHSPIVQKSYHPEFNVVSDENCIKDVGLQESINESLRRPKRAPISRELIKKVKKIRAWGRGIEDLEGLQYAINLKSLDLSYNPIYSLDQIVKIRKLRNLRLDGTEIDDISQLSELIELEALGIANTLVTDLSPIGRIKLLERVDVSGCRDVHGNLQTAKIIRKEKNANSIMRSLRFPLFA